MGKYPSSFGGASISPDERKKLQSGFWAHEYRVDKGEEIWRCDLHGLKECVKNVLMDYRESSLFHKDPHRYLDTRFGEGTAYCYFHKHQPHDSYFDYRTPRYAAMDLARGKDMAYFTAATSGNTFTTTATGTTSGSSQFDGWLQHSRTRERPPKYPPKYPPKSKPSINRLVRLPFKVETGGDLLSSLQREFDHWAGDQMKTVNG